MRDRKDESYRSTAERQIGRRLKPHEVVHHRNEDKTDGSPANLEVATRAKHTSDHNRARPLSRLRKALRMVRERRKLY